MKKNYFAALVFAFVMLVVVTFGCNAAKAECLIWQNVETHCGSNYFLDEAVDATEGAYELCIWQDATMDVIESPTVRWRWQNGHTEWHYAIGRPIIGHGIEDGHDAEWDILWMEYMSPEGEFVPFAAQAVVFETSLTDRFFGNVVFSEGWQKGTLCITSEYQGTVYITDSCGEAKGNCELEANSTTVLHNLELGDIIKVIPYNGDRLGLEQSYTVIR